MQRDRRKAKQHPIHQVSLLDEAQIPEAGHADVEPSTFLVSSIDVFSSGSRKTLHTVIASAE